MKFISEKRLKDLEQGLNLQLWMFLYEAESVKIYIFARWQQKCFKN